MIPLVKHFSLCLITLAMEKTREKVGRLGEKPYFCALKMSIYVLTN